MLGVIPRRNKALDKQSRAIVNNTLFPPVPACPARPSGEDRTSLFGSRTGRRAARWGSQREQTLLPGQRAQPQRTPPPRGGGSRSSAACTRRRCPPSSAHALARHLVTHPQGKARTCRFFRGSTRPPPTPGTMNGGQAPGCTRHALPAPHAGRAQETPTHPSTLGLRTTARASAQTQPGVRDPRDPRGPAGLLHVMSLSVPPSRGLAAPKGRS